MLSFCPQTIQLPKLFVDQFAFGDVPLLSDDAQTFLTHLDGKGKDSGYFSDLCDGLGRVSIAGARLQFHSFAIADNGIVIVAQASHVVGFAGPGTGTGHLLGVLV